MKSLGEKGLLFCRLDPLALDAPSLIPVYFHRMLHPSMTAADSQLLTRELDALDRVLHHIKSLLRAAPKTETDLAHWRAMRGTLRGKLAEDPLAYQRRVRAESERQEAR